MKSPIHNLIAIAMRLCISISKHSNNKRQLKKIPAKNLCQKQQAGD